MNSLNENYTQKFNKRIGTETKITSENYTLSLEFSVTLKCEKSSF